MNHDLFTTWFTKQLLPNIPEHALIIMDNALITMPCPCIRHRRQHAKRRKFVPWLTKNGIPIRDDCLKAELVEILAKVAPAPIYALDELGYRTRARDLRTPPYHPELQPIETYVQWSRIRLLEKVSSPWRICWSNLMMPSQV